MLILSLVLGSLVAMGMPILTAVLGLGAALSLVGLLGHLFSIPTSGPTLATMIGLGVGIDYALFLVTRHQEQLRDGMAMNDSIANAVATSGSAIVFAGGTVVIALLSLYVAGIPLVTALGLASAVGVDPGRARRDLAAAGAPRSDEAPHPLGEGAEVPLPAARARPGDVASLGRRRTPAPRHHLASSRWPSWCR